MLQVCASIAEDDLSSVSFSNVDAFANETVEWLIHLGSEPAGSIDSCIILLNNMVIYFGETFSRVYYASFYVSSSFAEK